jgi:hypothetical protein
MELGAVHCRRYGDGVGYAVSLSEQFARKKERLRRLMGYLDRVNEMVGKEAPRDPSMRAALRFRERTMSVWERVGMMCGVEAASARNVQRAMLRRICIHPWSERERALAAFACRYVKAGALARTLRGLGVLEG